MRRILVVGAHCDDETFGCGGLIRSVVREGGQACVLIASHIEVTREECNKACAALGCGGPIMLGFPHTQLHNYIPVMADAIRNVIFDRQIDEVYTQAMGDTHQDHAAVARATLIGVSIGGRVRRLAEYEAPLSSTRAEPFAPNAYVEIDIDAKLEALRLYGSQMKDAPHQRAPESVRARARMRGSECGCEYAEGFRILMEKL
jgi:N-acetylglucosamine malate deacetylase 1